jgi:hypothetical protein
MKYTFTENYINNILNILTEAKDYIKLTEAVPYSKAKEYLQIERSPEAESRIKEVFGKLKSLPNARQIDKRGWRIAFPYAEDSTEFEIQSVLEPYNFSIKDYEKGIALDTKNNREISLGKALNIVSKKESSAKDLIDMYAAIKSKGATNKDEDLMMVFSSAKYDIIGMSTGREWRSCMNVIDGDNNRYVKVDIKEGSIICYLTTISDTNLKKPLGRVLIKPYINSEDSKDLILYAELKTHGSIPNPEKFIDEVDDYMEKTQKLSGSYERLGCLYPDSERDYTESKENIRNRALKKLEQGDNALTKSEFISLPLKNKRNVISDYNKHELHLKYVYPFASQSQKKEYIKTIIKYEDPIDSLIFKGAPEDSKKEIIDYKIAKNETLKDYEFKVATKEQVEKYINNLLNQSEQINYFELNRATPEQVYKYINLKLSDKNTIYEYEFELANTEQKEKYISYKIENNKNLFDYELDLATPEQKEKYIDEKIRKKYELQNFELEAATQKQKEEYIDWVLNNNYELEDYELEVATPEQKEKYKEYAKN